MIHNKYIVDDRLIRGSKPNFRDIFKLKKEGVSQVLCVTSKPHYQERLACKLAHIDFVRYKTSITNDQFLNFDDFNNMTDRILSNKGKTYVHCRNGLHRTAECVAAYNMLGKGKSFKEVIFNDMLGKDYFGAKYKPENTEKLEGDSIYTSLVKKHNKKIYTALTKSFSDFLKIFKPTNIK